MLLANDNVVDLCSLLVIVLFLVALSRLPALYSVVVYMHVSVENSRRR